MKVMNKMESSAENEFSLLLTLYHENILRYFDHFHHETLEESQICIITEFCEVITTVVVIADYYVRIVYELYSIDNL